MPKLTPNDLENNLEAEEYAAVEPPAEPSNEPSDLELPKPLTWTPDEILALRARLGIGQLQMAELVGVAITTYNQWERGRTKPNRIAKRALDWLRSCSTDEVREAVAAALGIDKSELRQPDTKNPGGRFSIRSGRKAGYIQRAKRDV